MKYCHNCKLEHADASQFCKSCGGALTVTEAAQTCPACMAPVQPVWKFCKHCGYAFDVSRILSSESTPATSLKSEPVDRSRSRRRVKKAFIISAVLLLLLLFATGVAAAGWYALGVKVVVTTDPS